MFGERTPAMMNDTEKSTPVAGGARGIALLMLSAILAMTTLFPARAESLSASDFAILMQDSVTLANHVTVDGGLIGINGDSGGDWIGPGSEVGGIRVGGDLGWLSSVNVNGDIVANGSFSFGDSNDISGSVHAGGDVTNGNKTSVGADVVAGGNVNLANGNQVDGSVHAGQDVFSNYGKKATVGGDVVAGNQVSLHNSKGVAGQILDSTTNPAGNPSAPATYAPVTLPEASSFSTGSTDINHWQGGELTLDPGAYGDVQFNQGTTLNLTSGTYTFDSLNGTGASNLNLDLTGGGIEMYVRGTTDFAPLNVSVNGVALENLSDSQLEQAANVFLETHGDFNMWGHGSEWFGTVFAPDHAITVANNHANLVGSLLGDNVYLAPHSTLNYVGSGHFGANALPEADVVVALAAGLIGIAFTLRGRASRISA